MSDELQAYLQAQRCTAMLPALRGVPDGRVVTIELVQGAVLLLAPEDVVPGRPVALAFGPGKVLFQALRDDATGARRWRRVEVARV